MTTRTNSLEGGTQGVTLTQGSGGNTGGASGDYLDNVFVGSGGGLIFDNAHAAHGGMSMKSTSGATGIQSYAGWNSSMGSGLAQVWFRAYYFWGASPPAMHGICRYLSGNAGTQVARLVISTSGIISANDAANAAISGSAFSTAIPLNQWFRLEGYVISNATTGQVELKRFDSPDSATPTETVTTAATLNTGSGIGEVNFGQAGSGAANEAMWVDDMGVSTTSYIGPAGLVVPAFGILPALV